MSKSYRDLLREARADVREVTPARPSWPPSAAPSSSTCARPANGSRATSAALTTSPSRTSSRTSSRSRPTARRPSSSTARAASARSSPPRRSQAMGYADVASMSGGFQAWKSEGRPFSQPVVLSAEQKQRYSRHLLIPEVGAPRARRSCSSSKVLFVGAGGLGSPAMLYLAAAGVGTIGIVDFDVVDALQPPAPGRPPQRPRRA